MGIKRWASSLLTRPNASQTSEGVSNHPSPVADEFSVSQSPELALSSESTPPAMASSAATPSESGGRPVRASRGKRTSLAAGFLDSSTLEIDGDDDGVDIADLRPPKKARDGPTEDDENEDEPGAATPRGSPTPQPSPEPEPWELRFYPRTKMAVEKFRRVLGTPPPDTDDLSAATKPEPDPWAWLSGPPKIIERKELIVTLRLPPGTIDKNASFDPKKVGFMDLPGELRNQVYVLAFKTKAQIDFKARTGFSHSSAFLRVNKTIYNEARTVLYGKNRFVFDQSTSRLGNYFEHQWTETNYAHVRKFLTEIGPENTSLMKNIGLNLEDATPSGHPGTTMNSRRFEKNKDLYWILKCLGRYGKLEKVKLGFSGRRTLQFRGVNAPFLYALGAVKTDVLGFGDPHTDPEKKDHWDRIGYSRIDDSLKNTLEGVMVRPVPLKSIDPRLESELCSGHTGKDS